MVKKHTRVNRDQHTILCVFTHGARLGTQSFQPAGFGEELLEGKRLLAESRTLEAIRTRVSGEFFLMFDGEFQQGMAALQV